MTLEVVAFQLLRTAEDVRYTGIKSTHVPRQMRSKSFRQVQKLRSLRTPFEKRFRSYMLVKLRGPDLDLLGLDPFTFACLVQTGVGSKHVSSDTERRTGAMHSSAVCKQFAGDFT